MNQGSDRIKYVISVVLFGTIGTFLKFADVPSEVVVFWRGALGSLFVFSYLKLHHMRIDKAAVKINLKWLVLSGITLGINWIVLFEAYERISVAVAALCNYTAPVIFIAIAPLVLGEKLNLKKLPCIAVAFIGIILVIGIGGQKIDSISGILYGFAACACFVFILVCNRKLHDIEPLDKTLVQLVLSAVTVLPYVLARNHTVFIAPNMRSLLIVLLLGLVHTGVGYVFYFGGMGSLSVQSVAILGYVEPVVAVFCSTLILHEPLSLSGRIGAVMVIAAAVVSELIPDKRAEGR